MNRSARWFLWLCWIPSALSGVILLAARHAEGFAALAVAGQLVFPLYMSGFLILVGLGLLIMEHRARDRISLSLAVGILVAAIPLLWLGWRMIFFAPPSPPAREPVTWAFRCQPSREASPSWFATAISGASCSREALFPPTLVVWRCRDGQGALLHSLDPIPGHECVHLLTEIPVESFHVVRLCHEPDGEIRFLSEPGNGRNCRETIWVPGLVLE